MRRQAILLLVCGLAAASGRASAAPAPSADLGGAVSALAAKLNELWSPGCDGEPVAPITIKFRLAPDGEVREGPTWTDADQDARRRAAGERALEAVRRGQPYAGLPSVFYEEPIEVKFDQRNACR